MKNYSLIAIAALAVTACATPSVEAQNSGADRLNPYPAATSGQTRHVIDLPANSNEDALKVEIIVGQTKTVDCNHQTLGGELREETVQGWGYNYYIVPAITSGATTLMGCPAGSERQAFVTLPQQTIVRYNSKLPLVVYTPSNAEVRYRIWTAGEVTTVR